MFEVTTSYNAIELFAVIFAATFTGCAVWEWLTKHFKF